MGQRTRAAPSRARVSNRGERTAPFPSSLLRRGLIIEVTPAQDYPKCRLQAAHPLVLSCLVQIDVLTKTGPAARPRETDQAGSANTRPSAAMNYKEFTLSIKQHVGGDQRTIAICLFSNPAGRTPAECYCSPHSFA